ncbi:hypothetical protein GGR54DRAFT_638897 [Hypoxylon sp. NC1633]|nr:hypothetical protein GGR54DRAFT_638897 [Hypoxylon sp. NC1633]
MPTKENIRSYAEHLFPLYEPEPKKKERRFVKRAVPPQISNKASEWMSSYRSQVLHVGTPPNEDAILSVPYKIKEDIDMSPNQFCCWYIGGRRSYHFKKYDRTDPKRRMVSLVCTLIIQLIELLPDTFEDPTRALSKRNFDKLYLLDPGTQIVCISVPNAVELIKSLVAFGPPSLFFIFEGCDDLLIKQDGTVDAELTENFTDLLRHLATPDTLRKVRKILWVGRGTSWPIWALSRELDDNRYVSVQYPEDQLN